MIIIRTQRDENRYPASRWQFWAIDDIYYTDGDTEHRAVAFHACRDNFLRLLLGGVPTETQSRLITFIIRYYVPVAGAQPVKTNIKFLN